MTDAGRGRDSTPRGHVHVLGASIAGLLAARVLADHFDRVTVFERDPFTAQGYRDGVPQARHIHALMHRGSQIMEELFPGLLAEMAALGVPHTRWLERSRWYLGGTPMIAPRHNETTLATPSRPLLEKLLRTRVAAYPNVTLCDQVTVVGLAHVPGRITGIRTVTDGSDVSEIIPGDLIVDATGRNSAAGRWLAELGYRSPAESRVEVDLGYCSRRYRRRPDDLGGDVALTASTVPGMPGAAVLAIEGDAWHVTLSGTLGRRAPTDPAGYLEYAARLPVPDVLELIRNAEALDDPVQHRVRDSIRRRYEDLPDQPAGLIAMGDAVTSFNPIYAQGMTVAAQQALVLRALLGEPGPVQPGRWYRRIAPVIDNAWGMSTAIDLRSPLVKGERTRFGTLFGQYLKHVQMATAVSPYITARLLEVINLTRDPRVLLYPGVAVRLGGLAASRRLSTWPARRRDRSPAASGPATNVPAPRPPAAVLPTDSATGVGTLAVRERTDESDGVISLTLARPDGTPLPPWTPGAHIDVRVGDGAVRQYSLCGDPAQITQWRIAVLSEPAGRGGSAYLHEQAVRGARLTVVGLRNNFPLVPGDHTVLIAGGIGITPLLPMIDELRATGRSWSLHYGGRCRAAMAFAGRLADDPRCTLYPQDEAGPLPLEAILDAEPPDGTTVYCCGPEGLLAAVERLCRERPALTLRVERFRPRPAGADATTVQFYQLELRRSGITLTIEPGRSLIDELGAAGIEVPFSCREGTCASCETRVLAGDIVHRDSVLTDEERLAGNTMMVCVSGAGSERLVLDL
ncbi:2Fe-2S iron-sulfur cluster-binding protein [Frankia sp. R82]|uniref:2Fe-2S iron-sulfur cluster-binding protein n=1 Tax=Frankia sp. R82 TaxID=2950553 RepID=UPI00204491B6|nr:2Fe-2S iron-sulfur cluster-binding protein [Frankia sp. R82]MCM3883221.1 2Fe-2S iron-sulfur cluster-binding protein [Frankia sp. R82]